MSYDISIKVKVQDIDRYVTIATPEYDSPTYNLRAMFVHCMEWDYEQGKLYKCNKVIEYVENGIKNLVNYTDNYKKYNPSNGWGTLEDAVETLISLRKCIYETQENYNIPIENLYMSW